jgi:hypothetical protein
MGNIYKLLIKTGVRAMSKHKVLSRFDTEDKDMRYVYTEGGEELLGVVYKLGRGRYRVLRMDGKTRTKASLVEAFKTIRRSN